jgi:hypothetical protein
VERVPEFLDELARRLVPGCDAGAVRAVFARASAGYAGPRGRDGRRVTAITPSGVPFEVSVTGGGGRTSAALRYVTEAATGMPFFGPRLAAQRAALDDLVGWLPSPARAAADALTEAPGLLFPDPAAVPARTRFATTFGLVHDERWRDGLAGLKVYGNLRADEGSLGRLAGRRPQLADLVARVDDLAFLAPHFTTVEVDGAGSVRHKLYLRTRGANAAGLAVVARRFGADLAPLVDAVRQAGVADAAWRRPAFVCLAAEDTGSGADDDAELSLHLPAKVLGLDAGGMDGLAADLVRGHGDPAALAAVDAAVARAGGPGAWTTTVIGAGLAAGGGIGKVNVYVAPTGPATAAPSGAASQAFSNSGWTGSRVGA